MSAKARKTNWRPSGGDRPPGLDFDEIESYLSQQVEIRQAQQLAERFADRLPWLTASQRQVVVRHYTVDRLHHMSHAASHHVAERDRPSPLPDRTRRARLVATLLCAVAVAVGAASELIAVLAARR